MSLYPETADVVLRNSVTNISKRYIFSNNKVFKSVSVCMMQIKWEIVSVAFVGLVVVICWTIYGYKNNKFMTSVILKQNKIEPLAISPIINLQYFLLMRICFTAYCAIAWIVSNIYDFATMYSFYTVWNYTVLLFYFTSVTIFSIATHYFENGVPTTKYFNYYRILVWALFQCECCLSLLVDLTVWCILVPASGDPKAFLNYGSISMHILNVVFLLTDFFLNNIPFHFHFGAFAVLPPTIYLIFSWLYYDLSGKWDYFFMDSSQEVNAIWLSLVFMMHLLIWCFVFKIAQYKQNYFNKKQQITAINDNGLLDVNTQNGIALQE
eukprot:221059_1